MKVAPQARQQPTEFVLVADQWRQHLRLTHSDFAVYLGRTLSEWSHLRAGRRRPSLAFLRAVRGRASTAGVPWQGALDAAYQRDVLARVSLPAARPVRRGRRVS